MLYSSDEVIDAELKRVMAGCYSPPTLRTPKPPKKKYNTRSLIRILDDQQTKPPPRPSTSMSQPVLPKLQALSATKRRLEKESSEGSAKKQQTKPRSHSATSMDSPNKIKKKPTHNPLTSPQNPKHKSKERHCVLEDSSTNSSANDLKHCSPVVVKQEVIDLTGDEDFAYFRINVHSVGYQPDFDVGNVCSEIFVNACITIAEPELGIANVIEADICISTIETIALPFDFCENCNPANELLLANIIVPNMIKFTKWCQAKSSLDDLKAVSSSPKSHAHLDGNSERLNEFLDNTSASFVNKLRRLDMSEGFAFNSLLELITSKLHENYIHTTPSRICMDLKAMLAGKTAMFTDGKDWAKYFMNRVEHEVAFLGDTLSYTVLPFQNRFRSSLAHNTSNFNNKSKCTWLHCRRKEPKQCCQLLLSKLVRKAICSNVY